MAAKRYVALVAGRLKQLAATIVSAGVANEGDLVALDAAGKLDNSVMPVGIGADTKSVVSSENLSAGDWVNIYNNAGTANVRKADASDPAKFCNGFVLSAVTSPAAATVYLEGTNNQVSGQTPGLVFLQTTPGTGGATVPSTAGQIVQQIGTAVSATEVSFEAQQPVEVA